MKPTAIAIAAAAAASTTIAGAASASIIQHHELPNGVSSVSMAKDSMGISVAANIRNFKSKTTNGTTGVGIEGGNVTGEIDGSEFITFTFAQPVHITALQIGQLYTDGNFNDVGDEAARFDTSAGSFLLIADTATTADWNGFGLASNISLANNSGGGEWRIEGQNIFGAPITELILRSGSAGPNHTFGDFTFVELSYQMVPTPGAATLTAVGTLMMIRRRRNK
ncbi:MAG: hypothetical protein ACTS3F_03785 [Phycisphaerales bacterium]